MSHSHRTQGIRLCMDSLSSSQNTLIVYEEFLKQSRVCEKSRDVADVTEEVEDVVEVEIKEMETCMAIVMSFTTLEKRVS